LDCLDLGISGEKLRKKICIHKVCQEELLVICGLRFAPEKDRCGLQQVVNLGKAFEIAIGDVFPVSVSQQR
jgi:hypothetical protein